MRGRPDASYGGLTAHRRLLIALAVSVASACLLPGSVETPLRLATSWDVGVVVYLALTGWMASASSADRMRETVLANDQGRRAILGLVLLAIAASIAAIFFLLNPNGGRGEHGAIEVVVAVVTIVCSWLLTHVMFALHYAHRFYRDDPATGEKDATGGLRFPGDESPHYWDFLYFSFVIGMTSQVSDVQVTSRAMRKLVLMHGVLSFTFYTIVLAIGINIVAGLI